MNQAELNELRTKLSMRSVPGTGNVGVVFSSQEPSSAFSSEAKKTQTDKSQREQQNNRAGFIGPILAPFKR